MLKKIFTFFVLLSFVIIGFFHNSMMTFAMQTEMHTKMMGEMQIDCCESKKGECKMSCCFSSDIDKVIFSFNSNTQEKILKIKLIGFIDIFSSSSKFLENKNLIKNTSPPFLNKEIKYYSYSDLVKIIKSNI